MAKVRQVVQFFLSISGVHCTIAYTVCNWPAVALPAAYLRRGPPAAALLLRVFNSALNVWLNWSGFDTFAVLYTQVRGSFSSSPYMFRLAYRTKTKFRPRGCLFVRGTKSLELGCGVVEATVASSLVYVTPAKCDWVNVVRAYTSRQIEETVIELCKRWELRDNAIEVGLVSAVCSVVPSVFITFMLKINIIWKGESSKG